VRACPSPCAPPWGDSDTSQKHGSPLSAERAGDRCAEDRGQPTAANFTSRAGTGGKHSSVGERRGGHRNGSSDGRDRGRVPARGAYGRRAQLELRGRRRHRSHRSCGLAPAPAMVREPRRTPDASPLFYSFFLKESLALFFPVWRVPSSIVHSTTVLETLPVHNTVGQSTRCHRCSHFSNHGATDHEANYSGGFHIPISKNATLARGMNETLCLNGELHFTVFKANKCN
jgi:hypothetical protein